MNEVYPVPRIWLLNYNCWWLENWTIFRKLMYNFTLNSAFDTFFSVEFPVSINLNPTYNPLSYLFRRVSTCEWKMLILMFDVTQVFQRMNIKIPKWPRFSGKICKYIHFSSVFDSLHFKLGIRAHLQHFNECRIFLVLFQIQVILDLFGLLISKRNEQTECFIWMNA